jgi:hypothetical protein
MPQRNTGHGLRAWMRRLVSRLFGNDEAELDLDEKDPVRKEAFSSFLPEAEIASGDAEEDKENPGFRVTETRFKSTIWRLGTQDAAIGQPIEVGEKVLEAKADLDWKDRRAQAQTAINRKEARLLVVDQDKARLEKKVEAVRLLRFRISSQPLLPPHRTTSVMALIYITVGLAAFIGEIPLSITLIRDGLRLITTDLERVNGYAVFALTAMLCIFGLAVKLAYDSLTDWLARPCISETDPLRAQVMDDTRRNRRSKIALLVVNLVLLACCGCSLMAISDLRASAEEMQAFTNIKDVSKADTGIQKKIREVNDARKDAGKRTMLWLTITLPLFGAVSWMAGTTRIKQDEEDRKAYTTLVKTESRLAETVDEAARLKHEIDRAKATLIEEESNESIKQALLQTRLDVYRHGYQRGWILPEERPNGSLYELHVKKLRQRTNRAMRASSHA